MSELKNNFVYNINFNSKDLSNQLIKLQLFTNNYFKYNDEYIKEKYDIDSYDDFRNYFKKNYKSKLIFNCAKSEKLFINFINLDYNYFDSKYSGVQTKTIMDFFITGKLFYFNKCNENNIKTTDKSHIPNCNCKIKVKSIANIAIDALIFILKEFTSNYNKQNLNSKSSTQIKSQTLTNPYLLNDNQTNDTINTNVTNLTNTTNTTNTNKNTVKIAKNEINKQLLGCINKLEKAELKLGIDSNIDKHYVLNSVSEDIQVDIKSSKPTKLMDIGLSEQSIYEKSRFNDLKDKNKKFYFKQTDNSDSVNSINSSPVKAKINEFSHLSQLTQQYLFDHNSDVYNLNDEITTNKHPNIKNQSINQEIFVQNKSKQHDIIEKIKSFEKQLDSDFVDLNIKKFDTTYLENIVNSKNKVSSSSSESVSEQKEDNFNQELNTRIVRNKFENLKSKSKTNSNSKSNSKTKSDSLVDSSEKISDKLDKLFKNNNNLNHELNSMMSNLVKENKNNQNKLTNVDWDNLAQNNSNQNRTNTNTNTNSNTSEKLEYSSDSEVKQEFTFNLTETEGKDKYASLNITNIKEESTSNSESTEKPNDLASSIQVVIDYLDINNNILMTNTENITKLAIEIKKELKSEYSDNLAYKFDKIFQKSMMLKIISDTDDMKEYYKLYMDLIGIKKYIENKSKFNKNSD